MFRHTPAESEVTDFDLTFAVDQNVPWLYISMDDVRRVQKIERAEHVIQNRGDMCLVEVDFGRAVQNFLEVRFHIFEDQKDEVMFDRIHNVFEL